jgi:hypothetical protein
MKTANAVVVLLTLAFVTSSSPESGQLPTLLLAAAAAVVVARFGYDFGYKKGQEDLMDPPQLRPPTDDERNNMLMHATLPLWRRWLGYAAIVTPGIVILVSPYAVIHYGRGSGWAFLVAVAISLLSILIGFWLMELSWKPFREAQAAHTKGGPLGNLVLVRRTSHAGAYAALAGLLLLLGGLYALAVVNAREKPWALWSQTRRQYGSTEQKRLGRYVTQDECVREQWKRLEERRTTSAKAHEVTAQMLGKAEIFAAAKSVDLVGGRTIFEFRPSFFAQTMKLAGMDPAVPAEVLLPEITSAVSFFCAPSMREEYWPYYRPTHNAAASDLQLVGERTLATQAKEMIAH